MDFPFQRIAVTVLLLLLLICPAPRASAQTSTPGGSGTGGEIQPPADVGTLRANQEALEKLGRMTPEEIEAMDRKLAEALVFYYDRHFARALPIFQEIASQVETMDIMFWLGTSAMQVGQTELAVQKFKQMLAIDPSLHRVRLELAAAYFTMGRYEEARHELKTVQAASPPEAVQKNIERLLAAIDERTKKVFHNLRLSQGFMWDNNINAGPDQRELAVIGGTLTLGDSSVKRSDQAWVTSAAGNVLHDLGERNGLMWNTGASFYNRAYLDFSRYNYLVWDVTTGPWWIDRRDILKVPVGYTKREYGSDRLSYTIHVDPNYEHYFTQNFSLRGLYSYSKENYYQTAHFALDNINRRYELNANLFLANRRHMITGTIGYENHDADAARFSYDGPILGLSYLARFPTMTELFISYQWARRDYDDKPLLYDVLRKDKRHTFTAVLSQDFMRIFFGAFSFTYEDNHSNARLYEFDRTTYTISVGCRF